MSSRRNVHIATTAMSFAVLLILMAAGVTSTQASEGSPVIVEARLSAEGDVNTVDVSVGNNANQRLAGFEIVGLLPAGADFVGASPMVRVVSIGGRLSPWLDARVSAQRVTWVQPAGLDPGNKCGGYQYKFKGGAGPFRVDVRYWGPVSGNASSGPIYNFVPVTQLVESLQSRRPWQGHALLIVKDGETIYRQSFGAFDWDDAVYLASASKWLSAATVLSLVDEGLIALDDPVSRYLPSFGGEKATITIRQLLSHTSGLPSQHPCLRDGSITLAQCVDEIAAMDAVADPGTEFRDGAASYQVAGRVAEVASGQPWAELFAERIALPLHMTNTTYSSDPAFAGLATENPWIARGAWSSIHDYGNFLRMILDGGVFEGKRVLSVEAIDEMRRNQTAGLPLASGSSAMTERGYSYGLGAWRDFVDEEGNALQLSSPGSSRFYPWIDFYRHYYGIRLLYSIEPAEEGGQYAYSPLKLQQLIWDIIDVPVAVEGESVGVELPSGW